MILILCDNLDKIIFGNNVIGIVVIHQKRGITAEIMASNHYIKFEADHIELWVDSIMFNMIEFSI